MRYRYFICDVFTEKRFGGNPLAVLPDARGLTDRQMQRVTREFNFSESTFVLPPENGGTRRVRIFTPTAEIPFAGHPNVGTAFVLATMGELGDLGGADEHGRHIEAVFEEKAGNVPVSIERRDGFVRCELKAPERLSIGKSVTPEVLAAAVSLSPEDVVTVTHPPQVASVGLPFTFAELTDRAALERARTRMDGVDALRAAGVNPDVLIYVRSRDEFDVRARMFAPVDGVPEDPATGSANCALAALLAKHDPKPSGELRWRIAQGVEMGRPSVLEARAQKKDGEVVDVRIGGASVMVSEGWIEVED
jgi:trans-2,3-dihydro-3-hydroxyanthranilate isomerase